MNILFVLALSFPSELPVARADGDTAPASAHRRPPPGPNHPHAKEYPALPGLLPGVGPLVRVKQNADAANGRCLPKLKGDPKSLIAEAGVKFSAAKGREVPAIVTKALANVLTNMRRLGSGEFRAHEDAHLIFFTNDEKYSYYIEGPEIFINEGHENTIAVEDKRFGGVHNQGMLAHELAHYISFKDDEKLKLAYEARVKNVCGITRYARADRDEEFAEVFSAFVMNPSLFHGKGAACEVARQFMAELFQDKPENSANCAARRKSLIK